MGWHEEWRAEWHERPAPGRGPCDCIVAFVIRPYRVDDEFEDIDDDVACVDACNYCMLDQRLRDMQFLEDNEACASAAWDKQFDEVAALWDAVWEEIDVSVLVDVRKPWAVDDKCPFVRNDVWDSQNADPNLAFRQYRSFPIDDPAWNTYFPVDMDTGQWLPPEERAASLFVSDGDTNSPEVPWDVRPRSLGHTYFER